MRLTQQEACQRICVSEWDGASKSPESSSVIGRREIGGYAVRAIVFILLAVVAGAGNALADPGRPQSFDVRYAINMDFLPPLVGERRCLLYRPCDIVKLDHFSLTLTAQGRDYHEDRGQLAIHCRYRDCALERGQRSTSYRKKGAMMHFDVDDREYFNDSLAVMRYRGNLIGEVLLAY
jgi:hypothetical protein